MYIQYRTTAFLFLVGCLFSFAPTLFAATTTGASATASINNSSTVVVAKVSIKNATIIERSGKNLKISFDLVNGGPAFSGVRYGINLLTSEGTVVYEHPYEDVLNLDGNASKNVIVEYILPSVFTGDYKLSIVARAVSGMSLSTFGIPGVQNLQSESAGVFVDVGTCSLTVAGEKIARSYTLGQGVDILPSETLNLSCFVVNRGLTKTTFSPSFDTYYRTLYGDKVSFAVKSPVVITLAPNEKKKISFELATPKNPQAYDVVTSFVSDGKVISNSVKTHLVIRGESATIRSFTLDKSEYGDGDIAQGTLSWARSADSFPGSRFGAGSILGDTRAKLSISSHGIPCAADKLVPLTTDTAPTTVSVSITSSCVDPKASVSVLNGSEVLASREYQITTTRTPVESDENSSIVNNLTALIVVAILALGLIIFVVWKKRSAKNGLALVLFLCAASVAYIAHPSLAQADTISWTDLAGNTSEGTVDLDKTTYGSNDSIYLNAQFESTYVWCENQATTPLPLIYSLQTASGEVVTDGGPFQNNLTGYKISDPLPAGNYKLIVILGKDMTIAGFENSGDCYNDGYNNYCGSEWFKTIPNVATAEIPFTVLAGDAAPTGSLECGSVICASNQGEACTGEANACGVTAQGVITCDGTCGAIVPPEPSNWNQTCASPENSCGQTNLGTTDCSGVCSASSAPDESSCGGGGGGGSCTECTYYNTDMQCDSYNCSTITAGPLQGADGYVYGDGETESWTECDYDCYEVVVDSWTDCC